VAAVESTQGGKPRRRPRWFRGLLLRLAAVAIGLAPFVVVEAALVALDWGRPTYRDDPFVGFRAVHPLFVLNEEGTRYEVAPSRQGYFCPDSFARHKAPGEFRIFCLGGSTVQGRPFAIETSFTTWLELSLQAAEPDRKWEVVNCGGVSYASYRLVPILEEVLRYEPDLIVLCTGHNEFLEDRTYAHLKHMPEIVARPCEFVLRTRTYTLLREGYVRLRGRADATAQPDRPVLESEVDVMLDYRGGLDQYHRDDQWRTDVIAHFRYNLRRMVEMARDAGVPLILMNPVANLRDCPPFKSEHRAGLSPADLKRWNDAVARGVEHEKSNMNEAVADFREALAIDAQHAGLHYLLAQAYDALGMTEEARQSYTKAKELDVCPLRILEPMHEAILDVARETGTPLVDVRELYNRLADDGIPGGYWLVDHVHPSIPGHQQIANALADEMVRLGYVHPAADWRSNRDRRYREHLASLGDLYFAKGQRTLERVRRWTQGKASTVRPGNRSAH
jgi:lysophospholipase L1-like esterase